MGYVFKTGNRKRDPATEKIALPNLSGVYNFALQQLEENGILYTEFLRPKNNKKVQKKYLEIFLPEFNISLVDFCTPTESKFKIVPPNTLFVNFKDKNLFLNLKLLKASSHLVDIRRDYSLILEPNLPQIIISKQIAREENNKLRKERIKARQAIINKYKKHMPSMPSRIEDGLDETEVQDLSNLSFDEPEAIPVERLKEEERYRLALIKDEFYRIYNDKSYSLREVEGTILFFKDEWALGNWFFSERRRYIGSTKNVIDLIYRNHLGRFNLIKFVIGEIRSDAISEMLVARAALSKEMNYRESCFSMTILANGVSDTVEKACTSAGIKTYIKLDKFTRNLIQKLPVVSRDYANKKDNI